MAESAFVNPISDRNDVKLFIWSLVIGFFSILILKFGGAHQVIVTLVPCSILGGYLWYIWHTKAYQLRGDRAGDSVYYPKKSRNGNGGLISVNNGRFGRTARLVHTPGGQNLEPDEGGGERICFDKRLVVGGKWEHHHEHQTGQNKKVGPQTTPPEFKTAARHGLAGDAGKSAK